jgi:hypothetical protein
MSEEQGHRRNLASSACENGVEDITEAIDSDWGDFVANRCGRPPQGEQARHSQVRFGLKSIAAVVTRRRIVRA